MKKKKIITWILVLVCIGSAISILFAERHKIEKQLFKWLDNRLDYERSLDVGDEFNKVSWGDLTFQINHYKTGNKLEYVKDSEHITLLESVEYYKILNDKLYVMALDGYAVVDNNNVAKIYCMKERKNLNSVNYIARFEDFEKDDQEVFEYLS